MQISDRKQSIMAEGLHFFGRELDMLLELGFETLAHNSSRK